MSTNDDVLKQIQDIISSGITQSSQDGETVSFDLDRLKKLERSLRNNSLQAQVTNSTRPTVIRAMTRYVR